MKLAASGLVVTKYGLNGWTIKCIDRATGEEIYYNTKLPTGEGSWASEEEAFKAIGTKIASRVLARLLPAARERHRTPRRAQGGGHAAAVTGRARCARELVAMPSVITVAPGTPARPRVYDLQLAGSGPAGDVVAAAILKPLNAKLGQACFTRGRRGRRRRSRRRSTRRCNDSAVLGRLETNPPASLYDAPAPRQKAIVKNPETLKKLMI